MNPFQLLSGVMYGGCETSQTSSLLASKEMNFLATTAWSGNCYFTIDCQCFK